MNLHILAAADPLPSTRQQAWLEDKEDAGFHQVGPLRWPLGPEAMIVEVQGLFDRETFVIDREGNEL